MNAMTRLIGCALCAVCLAQGAWAGESNQITSAAGKIGRGFANMITCPFELARTLTHDVAEYSVPGLLTGVAKGSVFSAGRLWGGFVDVVALGSCPAKLDMYQQLGLKDFVWQECWLPVRPEEKK